MASLGRPDPALGEEWNARQKRPLEARLPFIGHVTLRDLPHKQPEALCCLVPIVRRAAKLQILDCGRTGMRIRNDVVKLE